MYILYVHPTNPTRIMLPYLTPYYSHCAYLVKEVNDDIHCEPGAVTGVNTERAWELYVEYYRVSEI